MFAVLFRHRDGTHWVLDCQCETYEEAKAAAGLLLARGWKTVVILGSDGSCTKCVL